jgi:hypothetical protein
LSAIPVDSSRAPTDALGRVQFARHLLALVQTIDAEHGAVIGLEGTWGSGKTWVLEQLQRLAEEAPPPPVFVTFNPWMVSGAQSLVEALLLQLAAQVASAPQTDVNKALNVAQKFIHYAGALSALKHLSPIANLLLPGSGLILDAAGHAAKTVKEASDDAKPALEQIQKHPERLSLEASRKAIKKSLEDFDRRVVVMVDDLDRLSPAEVSSIVQAIKAVADFRNVVYVLSYDPKVIAKGLEKSLLVESGTVYLEKIIQAPLKLPLVPTSQLRKYAVATIRDCLKTIPADAYRKEDLDWILPDVAAILATPRSIRRLETRLKVIAHTEPSLFAEINVGDLVAVEALELVCPSAMAWVERNASDVLEVGYERADDSYAIPVAGWGASDQDGEVGEKTAREAAKDKRRNELTNILQAQPEISAALDRVLRSVFHHLGTPIQRLLRDSPRFRVQRARNWYRWRRFVTYSEILNNGEIEILLKTPEKILTHSVGESVEAFVDFLAILSDTGGEFREVDVVGFAKVVVEICQLFGECAVATNEPLGLGPTSALMALLDVKPGNELRVEAAKVLCCETTLVIGYRLIKDWSVGRASLAAEWSQAARQKLERCETSWPEPQFCNPYYLGCWLRDLGGDRKEIKRLLSKFATASQEALLALLAPFADPVYNGEPEETVFPRKDLILQQLEQHKIDLTKYTLLQTFLAKAGSKGRPNA